MTAGAWGLCPNGVQRPLVTGSWAVADPGGCRVCGRIPLSSDKNCLNDEFMIIFRHQPPNFRLNYLSYHKKCSCFPRTSHQGLCPGPRWGLCPQTPAASPSQKSWIRHWSWDEKPEAKRVWSYFHVVNFTVLDYVAVVLSVMLNYYRICCLNENRKFIISFMSLCSAVCAIMRRSNLALRRSFVDL